MNKMRRKYKLKSFEYWYIKYIKHVVYSSRFKEIAEVAYIEFKINGIIKKVKIK